MIPNTRVYPKSNIVNMLLLMAGLLAAPIFFFVLFGKWAESPLRQIVGFSALIGVWMLAFIKRKHEILTLAIIFCSQFTISLLSFELQKPVVQTVLLFDILLIILLAQFIEYRERISIRHTVGWALVALAAWLIAVTPISVHVDRSLSFVVMQAKFVLLYLIISNLYFSDRFYKHLPWVICGILLVQTGLALLQLKAGYLGLAVLGERDPTSTESNYFAGTLRAAGTLGATNALGGYLAATLVFLMPFLLAQFNIVRYIIFLVGLIGLVIPLSRAGWLSFLIGAAIVVFQMFRSKLISPVKVIALGSVSVIMLGGVAYAKRDVIAERFSDKAAVASAQGRLGQFPYAWQMGMENPISGLGPGISSFYGSWNDHDRYIRTEDKAKSVHFNEQVHNSFLQYLLESGLPGALIFAFVILLVLGNALKRNKKAQPQQLIRMGAAAAAFSCLLHTQFGTEINNQQLLTLFAFSLGISTNKYLIGRSTYRRAEPNAAFSSI